MESEVLGGNITVKPEVTTETRKCECCGKELPISEFSKYSKGYRKICNACRHKENRPSDKFKGFTSRELIEELKLRGYKGELKKVVIEVIKM